MSAHAIARGKRALVDRNLALFIAMSLIWGATAIPVKAGVTSMPPLFFCAVRYILVAIILAFWVRYLFAPQEMHRIGRIVGTGVLTIAATYGPMFWGTQFVDSGIAALVNLALVPAGLFIAAALLGQERPTWRHAVSLALGAAGLLALFSNKLSEAALSEFWGILAIIGGTLAYCLGTVLSRPLLEKVDPLQLTTWHAIIGGICLLAVSIMTEPLSGETVRTLLTPVPLLSLLYLVLLGTIAAYTIYLRLVRDWGATKAGLYPFISPIIALALGWFVYAEEIGPAQVIGAALMLTGAGVAMAGLKPR